MVLNKIIKKPKSNFEQQEFQLKSNNPKLLWCLINTKLGKKKANKYAI